MGESTVEAGIWTRGLLCDPQRHVLPVGPLGVCAAVQHRGICAVVVVYHLASMFRLAGVVGG
jgi:hypothetical protein